MWLTSKIIQATSISQFDYKIYEELKELRKVYRES